MAQFPLMSEEAVAPETVQMVGVVEVYVTVNPEEAVAVRLTLVTATCVGMAGKVMVCGAWLIKKLRGDARRCIYRHRRRAAWPK